jgi:hypothetical protein
MPCAAYCTWNNRPSENYAQADWTRAKPRLEPGACPGVADVASCRLVQRNFELLRQKGGHVVRAFNSKQVSAEFLVHKLPRKS